MISYSKSRYTFKENELPTYRTPREDHSDIPSHSTNKIDSSKKETIHYTGDYLIGIATMHKSNAVPVFSYEDAIDISKMRR